MAAIIAHTSEAYQQVPSHARNEDLLTERPTLGIPRSCHNAQADLLRKQQVLGSNPSVGSTPRFVLTKSIYLALARSSRRTWTCY